jgi:hypothetical protein
MSLSRRFFLKSSTLTALGAVLVNKTGILVFAQSNTKSSGNFPIPASAQADMLYYSGYDMFAPYVNSIFTTGGARGEIVQMTLTSVTRYTPDAKTRLATASAPTTQTCSLMFSASGKLPEFSIIPTLNHPALGKLQMFLVYHGEGKTGYMYEAVINHLDGANIAPSLDAPPKKKKSTEILNVTPPAKVGPAGAPPAVAKPPAPKPVRKPGIDSL